MKLSFLLLVPIIFITFATAPAFGAQAHKPLTQDEVLGLVKFGMDSATLAQRNPGARG
jgi:hypothetical protein